MSFFKFPYTSYQQINLDWIMKTLNQLKDAIPLVQQASTVYNQSLETLDAANEAVETVTDQAAGAVTTANAAQYTAAQARTASEQATTAAAQANTTAAQANTTAAQANTTAQIASDIATTARETAITALANSNQALNVALWEYKTWIYSTSSGQNSASVDVTGKSTILLFAFDARDSYGKEIFTREIPLSMYIDKQGGATDGDALGYQWTPHNDCLIRITKSGNNMSFIFGTYPQTGYPAMYCHIFAR